MLSFKKKKNKNKFLSSTEQQNHINITQSDTLRGKQKFVFEQTEVHGDMSVLFLSDFNLIWTEIEKKYNKMNINKQTNIYLREEFSSFSFFVFTQWWCDSLVMRTGPHSSKNSGHR